MTRRPRVVIASVAVLLGLSGGVHWGAQRAPERAAPRAAAAATRVVELPRAKQPALSLPAPSVPLAAPSAPTPPGRSEDELMAELRALGRDPLRSIEWAREGNRRFPNSADAPERGSILIHALAGAGRSAEARGEAEEMVNRYPDSEWVREVERFTGAHRHRNVHLNDDGQLAFE